MANARPSVTKRQREQKKRERKLEKAERRAQRKNEPAQPDMDSPEEQIQQEPEAAEA
jgi:hypothetical protein